MPEPPEIAGDDAVAEWSRSLGDQPILLAASFREARLLVAQGLGLDEQSVIHLPPTVTRDLAHTLDRTGARQQFDCHDTSIDLTWREPIGGFDLTDSSDGTESVLDFADSLPDPGVVWPHDETAVVAIFGLHLSSNPERSGALLRFNPENHRSMALYDRLHPLVAEAQTPAGAIEQLARLNAPGGLAARHQRVVAQVQAGLADAAGLPVVEAHPLALPAGAGVSIPSTVDPSIFATYVRGELTPFTLLSELRPPLYRYLRQPNPAERVSAQLKETSCVGLIPCGPDYTDEEIAHAVLGTVKVAEYLGLRWWNNPQYAAAYAREMTRKYGPDHDAYRPAFPVPELPRPESDV